MIMVTLVDGKYHPFNLSVGVQQPVMFMVVNHGIHQHRLAAQIPLTGMQVVDPTQPTASPTTTANGTDGFDIAVPAGQEIDITFTPTARGQFKIRADAQPMGSIIVQ